MCYTLSQLHTVWFTLRKYAGFYRCFGLLNDLFKHLPLGFAHQGHGAAHFACSSCATHSVHVVLDRVGHCEVNDL